MPQNAKTSRDAKSSQSEGEGALDRILWRIARLHPGWVTLPVFCVIVLHGLAGLIAQHNWRAGEALSLLASLPIMAFGSGFAFYVCAVVSGRFHSRQPRRLRGPRIGLIAAFFRHAALRGSRCCLRNAV